MIQNRHSSAHSAMIAEVGSVVRIREDIKAHESWKGIKIEILEFNPIDGRDIRFRTLEDEEEEFSFLRIDEIECKCGNGFLWHDTKEKYFCPFCE